MYKLRIKRLAERDLRKLPHSLFLRINQHILDLRIEPRPPGVRKLKGKVEGGRIRVGDYRIVYLINDETEIITIVRIKHRRDVYR